MSIRAMNWALAQRTDAPSAQIVLYVIADSANEHGVTVHADPEYIAERTRQSRATVFRRLNELEAVGALTRLKRHREDGAPIYEIRLHLDRDVDYDKPPSTGESGEGAESQIETRTSETPEVSPVRPAESQSCDSISPPLSEGLPPTPPPGGFEVEGWKEFKEAFEGDGVPISKPSIVAPLIAALSEVERKRVTKAARGYIAFRAREKRPGAKLAAQAFVREIEAWAGWEKYAPADTVEKVEYPKGSFEYQALAVFRMLAFRQETSGESIKGRCNISPQFAALGKFSDDRTGWLTLEPEKHGTQISAWRNRIKEWSGQWVDLEKIPVLGPDGQPKVSVQTWGDKELKFPVMREVLFVPCEWPPRKDGSTGPPDQSAA